MKLIRTIYAKGREAEGKGRRLGQVDERSRKQAMDMLHGELAVALGIPVDQVEGYISQTIEQARSGAKEESAMS